MSDEIPTRDQGKFIVRMPDGMREMIRSSADLNGRSMNSEIVHRLKDSYEHREFTGLSIKLPEKVRDLIRLDAYANNQAEEEKASDILTKHYLFDENNTSALENLEREIGQRVYFEDAYRILKKELERDFVLYFNKTVQLHDFVASALEHAKSLPENFVRRAKDILRMTEAEMRLLHQRFEDGKAWVAHRDIEERNALEDQLGGQFIGISSDQTEANGEG